MPDGFEADLTQKFIGCLVLICSVNDGSVGLVLLSCMSSFASFT